ncbi:MAG: MFS transporter [Thermomicrobiales bacterium]|nr:MFS transporter [Thermomicrobiales bacterium]MCO5221961.1 MFS transporter [Thermomicrobiales bacterium]
MLRLGNLRPAHYAWVMAAVTFVILLGASGFRSAPSILIVPLQDEFGWSRATISIAVSINLLLFGFMGPFAAALMERFGIRSVVAGALCFIAAGAALTTQMTAPWQLYLLWGVTVGLGTGSMATVLAATVATRWFVQRRGLVVGVLAAASAAGQLVFLPLFAWLATNHGWRTVSLAVTIATLSVIPLALIFLRSWPSDIGALPYGAMTSDEAPGPRLNPVRTAVAALGEAARSRTFWLLAATFFICGATTNGLIGTHLLPASIDHGMTEIAAANMLALIGIFDIVGTTASGWLTDRFDPRKLLFMYYGLRGVALLILPWALGSSQFALFAFIVVYGLDWIATVPPTVALASKEFGVARGPLVYGWVFAAHQVGAAFAAYVAGLSRTVMGDYLLVFNGAAVLCMIAALCALRIGMPTVLPGGTPQPQGAGD